MSQISKIFDPLGYYLPVTSKGKILIQELWRLNLEWGEVINSDIQNEWVKISEELNKLFEIKFDRNCINENQDNTLVIFCDASKAAYGFCVYNVSNGNSKLMFSKSKVAPLKNK